MEVMNPVQVQGREMSLFALIILVFVAFLVVRGVANPRTGHSCLAWRGHRRGDGIPLFLAACGPPPTLEPGDRGSAIVANFDRPCGRGRFFAASAGSAWLVCQANGGSQSAVGHAKRRRADGI